MTTANPEETFRQTLAAHLAGFSAAPILFVGSGLSRRYLGLPDWPTLLEQLAALTDREYSYYRSAASGNLPAIAEMLTEPLQDRLWSPRGKTLRSRYTDHLHHPNSALKIFAADHLRRLESKSSVPKALQQEHDTLTHAKIDAVITTNYDGLPERLFPDYRTFVGQDQLVFSDPTGVAEIYKIHGSLVDPNSLVITESDYAAFEARNAYLAAKLLTFFAEHPVIFIGYSMGDPNVQSILSSLARCLTDEHISLLQHRLLFVNWKPGESHSIVDTVIGAHSHNIPVRALTVPNFQAVFDVLAALERKIPARTIRQIKEKLYKLVLDSKARDQFIHVADFDDVDRDDTELVVGVGVIAEVQKRGYKMVTRQDLCRNVIHDGSDLEPDTVVKMTLPEMLSRPGNFPMYKYLRSAGYLDSGGHIKNDEDIAPRLLNRIRDTSNLKPSSSIVAKAKRLAKTHKTLSAMIESCDADEVIVHFGALAHSAIELDVLHTFLLEQEATHTDANDKLTSPFTKAVCIYDLLKYGPKTDWKAL